MDANKQIGSHRRGFTVIEVLVVLLIVVSLMALAMPVYYSAMQDSQKRECRANMRSIANAEQEYKLKDAGVFGHTPAYAQTIATLKTTVRLDVVCPTGGTYTISSSDSWVTFTVHCSDSNHDAGFAGQAAGFTPNVNTQ